MLKHNRNRKGLHLGAQTIRTLDTASLAQAAGGDDGEPSASPRQRTCHGTVCLSILPE
jgi:hypothetical protein